MSVVTERSASNAKQRNYLIYVNQRNRTFKLIPSDHPGFTPDKHVFFEYEPYDEVIVHEEQVEVRVGGKTYRGELCGLFV
jgi:hypothetical protein